MRSVHVIVTGRVQGVGFRAWVEREAVLNRLGGWARNCRDGSVEIVIAGDEVAVAELIEAMWHGPPAARVDDLRVSEHKAPEGPRFTVLPTV